jgi:hypothetical protein
VATLNSVTNSGPISIPVTYDGSQYRMAFDHTIPCSNGPVTNYADHGSYVLTPTDGGVTTGRYLANGFTVIFSEDGVDAAAPGRCGPYHIEQSLTGTRTG